MNTYFEVMGILLLVNFPPASFILYLKFYQYNDNNLFDILTPWQPSILISSPFTDSTDRITQTCPV